MTAESQLDALALAHSLRQRLVDHSADTFFLRDKRLQRPVEAVWRGEAERGGLVSGLWVEGAFPSASSDVTLGHLEQEGLLPSTLAQYLSEADVFPSSRPLYQHQLEAWQLTRPTNPSDEPAVLVSAGTGAGKTEAFLLPVLSRLFSEPRRGNGMRCLILYPLNALIRDQLDRLDAWLRGQRDIRMFAFNSETPEKPSVANQRGIEETGPHHVRTRNEARNDPPDICITNYSMLEYMLARPQDAPFFGPGLEAVIIDEAHLYRGALAAEVALLLRRVLVRAGVDPASVLFIGTSATLGAPRRRSEPSSPDSQARRPTGLALWRRPRLILPKNQVTGSRLEPRRSSRSGQGNVTRPTGRTFADGNHFGGCGRNCGRPADNRSDSEICPRRSD